MTYVQNNSTNKIMLIYIRGWEAAPAAPARTKVTFCGIKFSEQTYY